MKEIKLPEGAKEILGLLHESKYEAFVVGGCVRDSLLGMEPHDWDICTDATPDQVKSCLHDFNIIETGIKHGTVTVMSHDAAYEVTTYRVDGQYTDHRRPDSVSFTRNLYEDLSRRDFTINAMAYNDDVGLVDIFGGRGDLDLEVIRCVGDANERFEEDALRVLRALRFASTYGYTIAYQTSAAIHSKAKLLDYVAKERIYSELKTMLMGRGVLTVLLQYKDVICQIIPELKPCVGFQQNNPYHCFDVYEHIANSVNNYQGDDLVVRLTLLLHDIGKPLCYSENETGGHFHGHAKVSQEIAKTVLERLKVDNTTRHDVLELVLFHDLVTEVSPKFVKKWLNKLGEQQFRRLMQVRRADVMAQSGKGLDERLMKCGNIEYLIDLVVSEDQPFTLKDLAVNGYDLMDLGMPAGRELGSMLQRLLDMVIDGEVENDRYQLLDIAQMILSGPQEPLNGGE